MPASSKPIVIAALLAALAAAAALAQPAPGAPGAAEKTAVAVLQFEPRSISQAEAVILSDRLRAELVNTGHYNVLEREQMDKILREQKLQLTGACSDASCLVKVGQLMAVTKMMGGTISKIGNTYTVQARVIDVERGVIETEVSQDFTGTIEDVQQWGMKAVVWKIVPSASLFVSSIPPDAEIYWDDRKVGRTNFKIENQSFGAHKLVLYKPGYEEYQGTVTLKEVRDYDVKVRLNIKLYPVAIGGTPPGATVTVNDTIHPGVTPCVARLPFGTYSVKVSAKGYHRNSGLLAIDRDQDYRLTIDLKRRSRAKAAILSLLFPGSGQRYSNRTVVGTAYMLSWLGGLAWTGIMTGDYMTSRSDVDDARDDYEQATTADAARTAFDEWQGQHDELVGRQQDLRTAAMVTGGLWALQFIDAMAFFPGKPRVAVAPQAGDRGELRTAVSLTYNW
ncbi:MAG: PEGA domain-containing protein [Candidatus Edwardsbacteria bacterium]|nr:PEGA domain-containing protein [Candidatus Edwardsbacteria bacterium]